MYKRTILCAAFVYDAKHPVEKRKHRDEFEDDWYDFFGDSVSLDVRIFDTDDTDEDSLAFLNRDHVFIISIYGKDEDYCSQGLYYFIKNNVDNKELSIEDGDSFKGFSKKAFAKKEGYIPKKVVSPPYKPKVYLELSNIEPFQLSNNGEDP